MLCLIFYKHRFILSQGFNSIYSTDGLNLVAVGNAGKTYRSGNSGSTWVSVRKGG
ncbi:MAG: hypothetical protein ABI462_13405 [Ignavibacteria bacterium]